eukprot:6187884-Pleurochrysis_carterae.AAC.4
MQGDTQHIALPGIRGRGPPASGKFSLSEERRDRGLSIGWTYKAMAHTMACMTSKKGSVL